MVQMCFTTAFSFLLEKLVHIDLLCFPSVLKTETALKCEHVCVCVSVCVGAS